MADSLGNGGKQGDDVGGPKSVEGGGKKGECSGLLKELRFAGI